MILVVSVLRHSECLTDDECQKFGLRNWKIPLTKMVALSGEKSKAAIAAFADAGVDPPEELLCK